MAHRRVQLGRRRRNLRQDALDDRVFSGASERLAPRQCLVERHAQRIDVRLDRDRLVLHLLRRHVEQRALVIPGCPRARMDRVRHAEVDDLHRIVRHHEDVARLQVAMDEAVFVRGVETAARLGEDLDDAIDGQAMAGSANELIERLPWQQGHDEERPLMAVLFVLPHVEDFDDVGMTDGLECRALFVEELERQRIGEFVKRLDRHLAVHRRRDRRRGTPRPSHPRRALTRSRSGPRSSSRAQFYSVLVFLPLTASVPALPAIVIVLA